MPTKCDLTVIGLGSGVFAAAIRANTPGRSVVVIECGTLGGTCVNTGYVLSKTLITVAGARHVAVDAVARLPGVATTVDPVDMPALIAGRQVLMESLRGEKHANVAGSYGQQVLRGDTLFVGIPDVPVLDVAGSDGNVETVEARYYLVATDSRPWAPPIDSLEEIGYPTSTMAMELTKVPELLLVLGGSYVTLEQAQLPARPGSQAMLLMRSRFVSKEEPEVSKTFQEVFADEGIRVVSRVVPTRVSHDTGGETTVTVTLSGDSQEFRADQVLVALGRRPVTDGLNPDAIGVNTENSGEVVVSDRPQSSSPRIWATGDVTGHPEFVYVTAHHGIFVAESVFTNADRPVDYARLLRVTFTGPTIDTVGMTEKDVLVAGIRCGCRVLPLHHVSRVLVNHDTRGFIKIVVNAETKEILGLTAVAKGAGEPAAAGVHMLGRTVVEVVSAWAPYLTMAEGIRIVTKALTTDSSLLSCCTWTATQAIGEISS